MMKYGIEDGHISIKEYLSGGGSSPRIGEKQVVAVMVGVLIGNRYRRSTCLREVSFKTS